MNIEDEMGMKSGGRSVVVEFRSERMRKRERKKCEEAGLL